MNSAHSDLARDLAWRLLVHSGNRFARFVTWVSFLGLALGVMVLTVVVTVMNGFDHELKTRLLQTVPHITVSQSGDTDAIAEYAMQQPQVIAVHDSFRGIGALSAAGSVRPISLYGIDGDGLASLKLVADNMITGELSDLISDPTGIVLGAPLGRFLGLARGDPVLVIAIDSEGGQIAPRLQRYNVRGLFEIGAEPDYGLAIVNLAGAVSLNSLGERFLQIQLSDPLAADVLAADLAGSFSGAEVSFWGSTYGELFRAVQLEKTMMFLLLALVVAIASFNIIAGQTMVVSDKRADIAILNTMGGSHGLIRSVFLLQGLTISVVGTALGLGLGLLCAQYINEILLWVESMTGRHLLDGSYFVEVPTRVLPEDLFVIVAVSTSLCMLSAWLPARRAASLDPVVGLHG